MTISSIPIKIKTRNRRMSSVSTGISSSKYVAQQRTKARNIVSCLEEKNIKLIAIDFDKTLLSIHTKGRYQGTVENLIEYIRSTFHYLIQEILNTSSFNQTLYLCIVSFSSQEQLIRELLQLAFQTSKADQIIIRCNTPEFLSNMNEKHRVGKEYHLSSVVNEISTQRNTIIKPDEILLFDDDVKNILIADKCGHKVLEIRDEINLDILNEFTVNILSDC